VVLARLGDAGIRGLCPLEQSRRSLFGPVLAQRLAEPVVEPSRGDLRARAHEPQVVVAEAAGEDEDPLVAQLGADIEILEPAELREQAARTVQAMTVLYG
jgi:predicted DNA-binding transcriptional regulator YafY